MKPGLRGKVVAVEAVGADVAASAVAVAEDEGAAVVAVAAVAEAGIVIVAIAAVVAVGTAAGNRAI